MSTKKPVLVVLAAGMGSRYGGLKQLDTFSAENDTLIDLSLYDAIQAGFEKVVFVIRKSFREAFESLFRTKLGSSIEIEFVYQEIDAIPDAYKNTGRTKPWGTAHALLCAKNVIEKDENFVVINADDFYGRDAYVTMANHLETIDPLSTQFSMMGYQLINTISEFGSVSRGECFLDGNNNLLDVIERTEIYQEGDSLFMNSETGRKPIDQNTIVSMNYWGFTPKVFDILDDLFEEFLKENHMLPKSEFYIPSLVNTLLKKGQASVQVLTSQGKWMGVTYPQDKEGVIRQIKELKEANTYPKYLWNQHE